MNLLCAPSVCLPRIESTDSEWLTTDRRILYFSLICLAVKRRIDDGQTMYFLTYPSGRQTSYHIDYC